MASVEKTDAGSWLVRWRDDEGRQVKKTFARKADAQDHATHVEHSMMVGTYVDPALGRQCFKDYAEAWRAIQVQRPKTVAQIESSLRHHVYPVLGHRPLAAIRPTEIQALVHRMSGDLAPRSVEAIYTWLATILKAAVSDRVIHTSPCVGIKLPAVEERRLVLLTPDVVAALIEGIDERYRAIVVLGAGTGVRISEALGLTVDRLDPVMRHVTVDRQLVAVRGGEPVFGPVKDRKNRARTIPLPETVGLELAAHLERHGPGPGGVVFTSKRGLPLWPGSFSEAWRRVADPLGLPKGDGFHQLRHFYASVLIAHGADVKVVQDRLGHTSATMTLNTYSHLWHGTEDSTREALDSVLGALAPLVRPRGTSAP